MEIANIELFYYFDNHVVGDHYLKMTWCIQVEWSMLTGATN